MGYVTPSRACQVNTLVLCGAIAAMCHALTGVLVETQQPHPHERRAGHALTGVLVETETDGLSPLSLCHALTGVLVETLSLGFIVLHRRGHALTGVLVETLFRRR